ncbi:MAG: hypothetical protein U9R32_02315 [Bacteroidota bacterium]|nr:hypothetical protein [Bacteroidota bacterium]
MKNLLLSFLFLMQLSVIKGQNNDSIENIIIKYKQLSFLSVDSQMKPLTLFIHPNGVFFLRDGFVKRPEKEGVTRFVFNKKGKQIKQYREKYKNSDDSLTIVTINNFFPKNYYKSKSAYLTSFIERFSIILQEFDEPLLYNSSDSNMFRVVFPCHNYMGDYNSQHYQSYNLVRVDLNKDILIYKKGHFGQNSDFVIDFKCNYNLNEKEIKLIQKKINGIDFTDENNIYYRKNLSKQRLFEFKNGEKYHMFLRADSYEEKLENVSYFDGLFNRLHYVVRNNIYDAIEKCQ